MSPFRLLVLSVILLVVGLVGIAVTYRHSGSGILIPAAAAGWGVLGIIVALGWAIISLF